MSEKQLPRMRSDNHMTPLHLATLEGHIEVMKLLLEHGVQKDKATANDTGHPVASCFQMLSYKPLFEGNSENNFGACVSFLFMEPPPKKKQKKQRMSIFITRTEPRMAQQLCTWQLILDPKPRWMCYWTPPVIPTPHAATTEPLRCIWPLKRDKSKP